LANDAPPWKLITASSTAGTAGMVRDFLLLIRMGKITLAL
jgi:hypothetical protein